jgi:ectoine hydroxylase-related dioxygenase (phytanoyl-CoA dioxygenase family)
MAFLASAFGDNVLCTGASFSRSDPSYPGMALHTDSHPYGSNVHAHRGTSPILVRALYYLDDLTPDCAPLKVVPYSHLSLHSDAMPYRRYRSHPEEVVVTCRAGDVVIVNLRVFHAAGANRSTRARRMLAASYRPGWARPTLPVPERDPQQIESLEPPVRRLFDEPNQGFDELNLVNWSDGLPATGAGLGPVRWREAEEK